MTHSPDHAERARAERLLKGDEDTPGVRPAVAYADHSYPAYSARQMVDFALSFSAALRGRDVVVEWEVWQDDMPVATSTDEADARHYLMVYGQDGPATLTRVERTQVARAALHDAKEVGA